MPRSGAYRSIDLYRNFKLKSACDTVDLHRARCFIEELKVRKKLLAVLAAVFVFSLIAASAASLGGVNNAAELGAETTTVAGCDADGITVNFTTSYNATTAEFDLAAVEIGDLDGCDLQNIDVEVYDAGGASLGNDTGTVSGNLDATYSAAIVVRAQDVEGVAVIVSG
jgi:hypothetical protein